MSGADQILYGPLLDLKDRPLERWALADGVRIPPGGLLLESGLTGTSKREEYRQISLRITSDLSLLTLLESWSFVEPEHHQRVIYEGRDFERAVKMAAWAADRYRGEFVDLRAPSGLRAFLRFREIVPGACE